MKWKYDYLDIYQPLIFFIYSHFFASNKILVNRYPTHRNKYIFNYDNFQKSYHKKELFSIEKQSGV